MPIRRSRRYVLAAGVLTVIFCGAVGIQASRPVPPEPIARLWTFVHGGEYLGRAGVSLQAGAVDCGVSVLWMLLEHHGQDPRLDEVRETVLSDHRRLTLLDMQEIARAHGIEAAGWRMDFTTLAGAALPLVAHYVDHYVVVDAVAPDGTVEVRDPALGRMRLSRERFERLWTGNVLLFQSSIGGPPSWDEHL